MEQEDISLSFGKKILNDDNVLVSGYLRELYDNTPNDIVKLCVLFWFVYEFDPNYKHPRMSLSDDNKRVAMPELRGGSIFFPGLISGGMHSFKFHIVKKALVMIIGLWKYSKSRPPIDTFFTKHQYGQFCQGYGYRITHGKKSNDRGWYVDKYGVSIEEGDIITMKVDLSSQSLSFHCNDDKLGVSHEIRRDKYKVAVYIYGHGVVQIL